MFVLTLLLSLNQGRLQEVETLVLKPFDLFLSVTPLSELLLLHELTSELEAGFVRGWRQGLFKSPPLPDLLNEFHLIHAGRQSSPKSEVADGDDLRGLASLDDVVRGEGVRLGRRLSVVSLNFNCLGLGFFFFCFLVFGILDSLLRNLHHYFRGHCLQHRNHRPFEVNVSEGTCD